jgi:methylated-DNA-[protein]-cysteine S-methyltransferase
MDLITVDTPAGTMALAEEYGALTHIWLPGQGYPRMVQRETALLACAKAQLLEYFQGKRRQFDLPLAPQGTPFRRKVWDALLTIPYGETITYWELAHRIGSPKAVRAVGQANHHNPLSIFIPCHRVVGANGSLTGYGGGLALKQFLLELEGSYHGKA